MLLLTNCPSQLEFVSSEHLVEELLSIALHSITFLRCIFDDNSYQWASYRPDETRNISQPSLKYKQLIRGVDKKVDKFVNWIDSGVNDAIKRKALSALQFAIATDPAHPNQSHECYLFQISYDNNDLAVSSLDSSPIESPATEKSVDSAKDKVLLLLRRLIILTQDLTPLPAYKSISFRLLFNENCCRFYQPPGFRDAQASQLPSVYHTGDECVTSLNSVNTGHHTLGVTIYSPTGKQSKEIGSLLDPFELLDYNNRVKSLSGIVNRTPVPLSLNVVKNTLGEAHFSTTNNTLEPKEPCRDNVKRCECKFLLETKFAQDSFDCSRCARRCHLRCYGYIRTTSCNVCFTCILGKYNVDFDILLLMRVRMYFAYLKCYPFPEKLLQIGSVVFDLSNENLLLVISKLLEIYLLNGIILPIAPSELPEIGCGAIIVDVETTRKVEKLSSSMIRRNYVAYLAFYPITKRYNHKNIRNPSYNQSTVVHIFCPKWSSLKYQTPSGLRNLVNETLHRGGYFNRYSQLGPTTDLHHEMDYRRPTLGQNGPIDDDFSARASLQAKNQSICAPSRLFESRENSSLMHEPDGEQCTVRGLKRKTSKQVNCAAKGIFVRCNSESESPIESPTISELANYQSRITENPIVTSDDLKDITFEDSFVLLSQTHV